MITTHKHVPVRSSVSIRLSLGSTGVFLYIQIGAMSAIEINKNQIQMDQLVIHANWVMLVVVFKDHPCVFVWIADCLV